MRPLYSVVALFALFTLPATARAQTYWGADTPVRAHWEDPHYHSVKCAQLGPKAHEYWSMALGVAVARLTPHSACDAPILKAGERLIGAPAGPTALVATPTDTPAAITPQLSVHSLVLVHPGRGGAVVDPEYHVIGCAALPPGRDPAPYFWQSLSLASKQHDPHKACVGSAATALTTASAGSGTVHVNTNGPSDVSAGSDSGTVHVKGYRRKDGTYVPAHTRRRPRH
jgi:hypothetical protein